jgi:hypothetical protein
MLRIPIGAGNLYHRVHVVLLCCCEASSAFSSAIYRSSVINIGVKRSGTNDIEQSKSANRQQRPMAKARRADDLRGPARLPAASSD